MSFVLPENIIKEIFSKMFLSIALTFVTILGYCNAGFSNVETTACQGMLHCVYNNITVIIYFYYWGIPVNWYGSNDVEDPFIKLGKQYYIIDTNLRVSFWNIGLSDCTIY